jgi:hypothetical protein
LKPAKKLFLEVHSPTPGAAPEAVTFDLDLDFSYRRCDRLRRVAERLCGGPTAASCGPHMPRGDFAYIAQRRRPYIWTDPLRASFKLFFFTNV